MSLDSFTDTRLSALLMLASGAANADHEATAEEPVVRGAVAAPMDPATLGQMNLPALFAYRQNAAADEESQYDLNTDATYVVDYWLPVTGIDRIALRWPLLDKVWETIAKAIQGGMHPDVSSGVDVMRQAGLTAALGNTTRVDFSRAPGAEGGWYPFFRATFRIREDRSSTVGVTDVDGLPAFLESATVFALPGATETTPAIESELALEGYPVDP